MDTNPDTNNNKLIKPKKTIKKSGEGRIEKKDRPILLSIFFKVIGNKKFIDRSTRTEIKKQWSEAFPAVSEHQWRQYIYAIECDFYEKVERYNAAQLTGKITKQLEQLTDDLQDAQSKEEILKKSHILNSATKSLELMAKINKLYEQAPVANILISHSVNEDELLRNLNKSAIETLNINFNEEKGE